MELEKYLKEILGVEVSIVPLDKRRVDSLPLYITQSYVAYKVHLFDKDICLLRTKADDIYFTPDQISRQKSIVADTLGMAIVFVFKSVVSYNLKRYIQKGINFIIPGKQLYAPDLLVDIRKTVHTAKKRAEKATPMGQFTLLYHLQKQRLDGMTISNLSSMFSVSYLNMNRAIKNLSELNLCYLSGGKEKQIQFMSDKRALWNMALPSLVTPIQKIMYTDDELEFTQSGINALAYYTMLNDERRRHYAIGKESIKTMDLDVDVYYGNNNIEVWKYNPVPLSEDGMVDRLSLYIMYKDNEDERIQGELKTLIDGVIW